MRRIVCLCFGIFAISASCKSQYSYPHTGQSNDTIKKFGLSIADPYRWLEDFNSKETQQWLAEQEHITTKYRNSIYPEYTSVRRSLAQTLVQYGALRSLKSKTGEYFFAERYDYDTDNSPTIVYKRKISQEWGKLLSTAQFLKDENDAIAIQWYEVSPNDSFVAIGLSHGGSDWTEIVVVNIYSLKLLPDHIAYTKFGCGWGKQGFFYLQYEKPNGADEISSRVSLYGVFYHKLNTAVEDDFAIISPDSLDKEFNVIENGKFLITHKTQIENNKKYAVFSYIYTDSLEKTEPKPFIITPHQEGLVLDVIGEHKGAFIVQSNFKSPNGRIMSYNYTGINQGKQLIEMFNQTLISSTHLRNRTFCTYLDKGNYTTLVFDDEGQLLKKIDLPEGMNIEGFNRVYHDSLVYYYVNSFSRPGATMRYNLNTLKSELVYSDVPPLSLSFALTTKIVSYLSKDSTRVYMYLIYNTLKEPDETSPALIYAYGGFGIANRPTYNPLWELLLEKGAIIAVPLIRGGGEFGHEWHEAGRRLNKQNSIDDVAFAAKWLTENKYSSSDRIVLQGGSQGAWLMADAMIQYPSLFKAVVPSAGIYDMLRYHLFSNLSGIGYEEFGNPEDSIDFRNLYKLSPYHQIQKNVQYPACLAIIGNKDDRVVPFHSFKLIARLQENAVDNTPYFLYLEPNTGHNNSASLDGFDTMAFTYTFIMKMMNINVMK